MVSAGVVLWNADAMAGVSPAETVASGDSRERVGFDVGDGSMSRSECRRKRGLVARW
jgi:hypothetical protein